MVNMKCGGQIRPFLILFVSLFPLIGNRVRARDQVDESFQKEMKTAVSVLKRASYEERLAYADRLALRGEASQAIRMAWAVIPVLATNLKRTVSRRDAQGKRLLRHFENNYKLFKDGARWTSVHARARYQRLLVESRALNAEVGQATGVLERFVLLSRSLGKKFEAVEPGGSDPGRDVLRNEFREHYLAGRVGTTREKLLSSLDGPFLLEFSDLITEAARLGDGRDERLEAISCAGRFPSHPFAELIASCGDDPDPFIRRAVVRVVASKASTESVDYLVGRLDRETGLPRREILDELGKLTGENLGRLSERWQSWWASSRPTWRRPPVSERTGKQSAESEWRYFGIELDSKRVVFVLDISGSMGRRVGYKPKQGFLRELGRVKMELARVELEKAITGLQDDTRFNVIAYNTKVTRYSRTLVPATADKRRDVKRWTSELNPQQGTNTFDPLLEALQMSRPRGKVSDEELADTILFLSDGEPTCGSIPDQEDILAEVRRINPGGRVTIHCIHLGNENGAEFMESLASENGGRFVHAK